MMRFVDGGRDRIIEILQMAFLNNDPVACQWWQVYAELPPYARAIASFDDICAGSGVRPDHLCMTIVSTAMRFGADVGNLVAAMTHPKIIDAMVRSAERIDGEFAEIAQRDRVHFLQGRGFLPAPKSTVVGVHVSASAQAAAAAQQQPAIPRFGDDIAGTRAAMTEGSQRLLSEAPIDPFTELIDGATDAVLVPVGETGVDTDLDGY